MKELRVRAVYLFGGMAFAFLLCSLVGNADATEGQFQKNTGCHNSKKVGFHCHDKKGNVIKKEVRNGPNKECEFMLKWLAGERKNSYGHTISKDWHGAPLIRKSDADTLVRECRK